MTRICCPFDRPSTIGGASLAGSALVDLENDPWDGLLTVLPLNETGAGIVGEYKDRTRKHFDGTGGKKRLSGEDLDTSLVPTLDVGVYCQPSQHFDGRQYIWIEQDTLGDNQEFTVTLWFKFETTYKSRVFYSRGFATDTQQYVVSLGHSFLNTISLTVNDMSDNGTISEVLKFGTGTLTVDEWYHVGMVYDQSRITLYVNGESVGSQVVAGTLLPNVSENYLGALSAASNLEGNLQELHVFPEAKSAAYIKAENDAFCSEFVIIGDEEPLVYW